MTSSTKKALRLSAAFLLINHHRFRCIHSSKSRPMYQFESRPQRDLQQQTFLRLVSHEKLSSPSRSGASTISTGPRAKPGCSFRLRHRQVHDHSSQPRRQGLGIRPFVDPSRKGASSQGASLGVATWGGDAGFTPRKSVTKSSWPISIEELIICFFLAIAAF
jgi:hypothetical protein